jgi:septal ring factor EnvC (AmiA/AmiB activator)
MKSIIAAIVTCVVLFGISLGATHFLLPSDRPEDPAATEVSEAESAESEDEASLQQMVSMPVSFRPENEVSVESVLQMSESIKKTEQQLIAREKEIAKQEQRVRLLFQDLETEQDELKAFSEGVDQKVEMLSRMNETLQNTIADIDAKRAELEALQTSLGEDDESKQAELDDRVKAVTPWFSSVAPEQASTYLKEMANNGRVEFAASLLNSMPDRQKSKILGAMNDPLLVEQLIEALRLKPKKEN